VCAAQRGRLVCPRQPATAPGIGLPLVSDGQRAPAPGCRTPTMASSNTRQTRASRNSVSLSPPTRAPRPRVCCPCLTRTGGALQKATRGRTARQPTETAVPAPVGPRHARRATVRWYVPIGRGGTGPRARAVSGLRDTARHGPAGWVSGLTIQRGETLYGGGAAHPVSVAGRSAELDDIRGWRRLVGGAPEQDPPGIAPRQSRSGWRVIPRTDWPTRSGLQTGWAGRAV